MEQLQKGNCKKYQIVFFSPELSSLFSSMLVSFDAVFKKLFTASCAQLHLIACFSHPIGDHNMHLTWSSSIWESPCFSVAGVFWRFVQPLWRTRPRPPDSFRWNHSSRTLKFRSSCFDPLVAATVIHFTFGHVIQDFDLTSYWKDSKSSFEYSCT